MLHKLALETRPFDEDNLKVFRFCAKHMNTLVKNNLGRTCLETALCQDSNNIEHYVREFGHRTHKMEWIVIKVLTTKFKPRKANLARIIRYYSYGSMVSPFYLRKMEEWGNTNSIKVLKKFHNKEFST